MEASEKRRIVLYADAIELLGGVISKTELYYGLRSHKYPGFRAGGTRGRWLVDIDLLQARITELMQSNINDKAKEECQYGKLRRIKE